MLDHPWIRLVLGAVAALLLGLIAVRVIASVPRDDGRVTPSGAVAGRADAPADGRAAGGVPKDAERTATAGSGTSGGAEDAERPTVSGAVGLTVHVTGAVRKPGVYRLGDGARVVDAVRRAGGTTRHANPQGVNQAAELRDGQQVVVPAVAGAGSAGGTSGGAAGGTGAGGPGAAGGTGGSGTAATTESVGSAGVGAGTTPAVDLNTATTEQLDQLEGVGPTTAAKIIRLREERGGIGTVDDLAEIPGIGPKKLEALRAQLEP